VQARGAGQGDAQLPLTDDKGLVGLTVEHTGNQALRRRRFTLRVPS
jgi:hypothetical protein